jgi:hypothetical protein
LWNRESRYYSYSFIEPRRGFAITNSEDSNKFIVRDGIVVDTNFMEMNAGERKVIGKHNAQLSLVLHLLPIPKNGPLTPMSLETANKLIKEPDFTNNVSC